MFWNRPRIFISIQQGERGRWRWSARDSYGRLVAVAPVQGWSTRTETMAEAKTTFKSKVIWM